MSEHSEDVLLVVCPQNDYVGDDSAILDEINTYVYLRAPQFNFIGILREWRTTGDSIPRATAFNHRAMIHRNLNLYAGRSNIVIFSRTSGHHTYLQAKAEVGMKTLVSLNEAVVKSMTGRIFVCGFQWEDKVRRVVNELLGTGREVRVLADLCSYKDVAASLRDMVELSEDYDNFSYVLVSDVGEKLDELLETANGEGHPHEETLPAEPTDF